MNHEKRVKERKANVLAAEYVVMYNVVLNRIVEERTAIHLSQTQTHRRWRSRRLS